MSLLQSDYAADCSQTKKDMLYMGQSLLNSKVVAIVQARMRSRRLPQKMLANIEGRPLLWHVVVRAKASACLNQVLVATTDGDQDNPIEEFCEKSGFLCFRGSEEDVLDRFYQAALSVRANTVVRITGDCPLIDPNVVDMAINRFSESDCDYVSNLGSISEEGEFYGRTFPDGLDVEVFSFAALERAWREAKLLSDREHVTPYIYRNPTFFRTEQITQEKDLSQMRWTVDEPEDLEFVRRVFANLYGNHPNFTMNDIIAFLNRSPELSAINGGFTINEGYRHSLEIDRNRDPRGRSGSPEDSHSNT